MFYRLIKSGLGALLGLTLLIPINGSAAETSMPGAGQLVVYKSPTCGCCSKWVNHLKSAGLSVNAYNTGSLDTIKRENGVPPEYRSCHTAVWNDGEYVFEGHVPARLIQRFLKEQPEGARGLSVPGMPMGSPGMEMGNRFQPYDVLLLQEDGSTSRYERISSIKEQY